MARCGATGCALFVLAVALGWTIWMQGRGLQPLQGSTLTWWGRDDGNGRIELEGDDGGVGGLAELTALVMQLSQELELPDSLLAAQRHAETFAMELFEDLAKELTRQWRLGDKSSHAAALREFRGGVEPAAGASVDMLIQEGWKAYRGTGMVRKDLRASCLLWGAAAARRSGRAAFLVGENVAFGEGVPRDQAASTRLFIVASQWGYAQASTKLGLRYVDADSSVANHYLLEAVANGDAAAVPALGDALLAQERVGDAVTVWAHCVRAELALECHVQLALALANGVGVERDGELAVELLQEAASGDEHAAVALLAASHALPALKGVAVATADVRRMQLKSMSLPPLSCFNVGVMLMSGRGLVPRNLTLALTYFRRAAEAGLPLGLWGAGHVELGLALALDKAPTPESMTAQDLVEHLRRASRGKAHHVDTAMQHVEEACMWLTLATEAAHSRARALLAMLQQGAATVMQQPSVPFTARQELGNALSRCEVRARGRAAA